MSAQMSELFEKQLRCPYCFGRGYRSRHRKNGKLGSYIQNCRSCGGMGQIDPEWPNYNRAKIKSGQP